MQSLCCRRNLPLPGEGTILSKHENFDVCVIGSGAAGGVMAKELCESGAKVVMLEAGKGIQPWELLSHKWPYELPFRDRKSVV